MRGLSASCRHRVLLVHHDAKLLAPRRPGARHIVDFQETGQRQLRRGQLRISRALDLAERGRSIAALRRKIEHSRHPERLATPDKTR
jgi:hypothetical protein